MYHKIEIGARVLDTVEFVILARALGVDPLELFGRFLINLQKNRVDPAVSRNASPSPVTLSVLVDVPLFVHLLLYLLPEPYTYA